MTDIHKLVASNRNGEQIGIPSFCTANPYVIEAIMQFAKETGFPTLIEATCNQVNQEGGYTGMTPIDYINWVYAIAKDMDVPRTQLIMGGDHLGPNPWKHLPAKDAMEHAKELVKLYVEAGFTKIHLDASMACADDDILSFQTIAERAAELCAVAEKHAPNADQLIYIIGTEVPIPGGESEELDALDVTTTARFEDTLSTHQAAFDALGLDAAWSRVVSVVTQPGVDFSHSSIYEFIPEKAEELSQAVLGKTGLTFEAHSTDYQPDSALASLVDMHFFFLKVGPELTFRFREAVYALANIEAQYNFQTPSNFAKTMDKIMSENDKYWSGYYHGDAQSVERMKIYSYSDRIRYYWANKDVNAALEQLLSNLNSIKIDETIISQFFMDLPFGEIPTDPKTLISNHIAGSIERYFAAAGFHA